MSSNFHALSDEQWSLIVSLTVPPLAVEVGTYSQNLDWICNDGLDLYLAQNFIRIGSCQALTKIYNNVIVNCPHKSKNKSVDFFETKAVFAFAENVFKSLFEGGCSQCGVKEKTALDVCKTSYDAWKFTAITTGAIAFFYLLFR
jgi:hypothetical protein